MENSRKIDIIKNLFRNGSISANYSYMMLASVCRAVLSLFLMAILARYLGVAHFGIFSYALAFGEFFVFLADFGLPTVFIRDAAARVQTDEAQVLYSNTVAALLVSLTITYLLINAVGLILVSPENYALIRLLALAVMFGILTRMGAGVFRIFDRMQYEAVTVTVERFLTLIAVAVVALLKGSVQDMALAWVAGSLGGCLLTFAIIHRNFLRFRPGAVTVTRVLKSLREAAPLALASCFTALKDRAGLIILQAVAGSVALGLFSASYRLLALPYAFALSFQSTIISTFSRLSNDLTGKLQEAYKICLRLALVMGFVLQALVMFMAVWAIPLLYGEEFHDSLIILQILSLTIIPIFGYLVTTSLLMARKQNRALLLGWIAAGLTNVILSRVLCAFLGSRGLAWSLVVSELVLFLTSYLVIKVTFGAVGLWSPVAKNFAAIFISGIAYISVPLLGGGYLTASITAGCVYLAVLSALRIVTVNELSYLTSSNMR